MADDKTHKSKGGKVEKEPREEKKSKKKRDKKGGKHVKTAEAAFSLLADDTSANPALSALFAATPPPSQPAPQPVPVRRAERAPDSHDADEGADEDANDAELSSIASEEDGGHELEGEDSSAPPAPVPERRRKRKHDEDEIEDVYMRKLEREEAKDAEKAAAERDSKRQKKEADEDGGGEDDGRASDDASEGAAEDEESSAGMDDDAASPPPKHETEIAADVELSKANRTVFLGNVSTAAISSKGARKQLVDHLKSFFQSVAKPKQDDKAKFALESLRFRSTPYASAVPKKAAFATKQLMDATAKCTNAYAVYSHPQLAREAAKQLNASEVLGRHLRVDEVAHPSRIDHKRCVFVGNLGFVDDESNINQANEEDGREKRKPGKEPADIDEGLWRTFSKCGKVESVRVVRDGTTRVGKGIAYVQFEDGNAVEAALLYDGKKFPPMLPRKLRVSRSKAQKRNAKPGSGRPTSKPRTNGYQRKVTGEEASQMGRAGKLYGRAAAAQAKKQGGGGVKIPDGVKKLEDFVFEGHRASSTGGKAGLKLGGKGKKKAAKPTNRSAKRGAAFKASKKGK